MANSLAARSPPERVVSACCDDRHCRATHSTLFNAPMRFVLAGVIWSAVVSVAATR